jgi:tetratricopeptide (TPR) repeat protein
MRVGSKKLPLILASLSFLMCTQTQVLGQDLLWRTYFNSAQKEYAKGNFDEAEKLLNAALNVARKYDDSVTVFYYLAKTAERRGDLQKAEGHYETVLEYLGPKVWATLRPPEGALEWEDNANVDSDALLSSTEFVHQLPKRKEPYVGRLAKPITTVDVLTDIGTLFHREHKDVDAEKAYRQALQLVEHRPNASNIGQAGIMQKLSDLYTSEGKDPEAQALRSHMTEVNNEAFPDFSKIVEKNLRERERFGANTVQVSTRLNNLALYCATHGDYVRAELLYKRALENCKVTPVSKKSVAVILRNYADLLQSLGRHDEAQQYLNQADTYKKDLADKRPQGSIN